jgi:hypothetical protein
MERLLARLERRFGRFAVENVAIIIAGGMGVAALLVMAVPGFAELLALDPHMVARGQVWRLFTYLFLPANVSPIWIVLEIYWTWLIVSNLEHVLGAFRLNIYYLLGMIGTTIAAYLGGGAEGNWALNLSLLFAFATVLPDYEIFLFFILRVKIKWLALLSAAFVVFEAVVGTWPARAALLAAFGNYLLFFSSHLWTLARGQGVQMRQRQRREAARPSTTLTGGRSCAMCGKKEADGADIRVCTCERFGGPKTLCLEHARNH